MTVSRPLICTFTGKRFNPLDPNIEDIDIIDIAHALSNVCRYGGHCKQFYSVAQHSVLVARNVSPEHARWGLLHDASEAYIGDIVAPLKVRPEYEAYREAEDNLMQAICQRFGLSTHMPTEVKDFDLIVRATEMRDFGSVPTDLWGDIPPLEEKIIPYSPEESRILFLNTFETEFGVELGDLYDSYIYSDQ